MNSEKTKLVPKLRFPEFRDAGEWEETRLSKLGKLVSGLTYSPDDVRESGLLVLRSSNVQNREIALDDCVYVDPSIKGANLSQPGDILICVRNGSKALIGKCALIPQGMPLCTHGAFMTVFRAETAGFVFQLFQSDKYQKQVAGDLGATINSINGSQFLKYEFMVPKPAEQQKIADCLTSLDELIAAQGRKVEALKTHKKGLMQKLFPREGETQPRLRFPEFQSAEKWREEKLLSLSSELLSNGVFNDPKKVGSGYKLINVSDMYIETTIEESRLTMLELSPSDFEANRVITGDIFFTRSSLVKSGIAVSNIYLGSSNDVTYDGHLIRFRPSLSKVFPMFAHYLFKTELIRAQLIARGKTATMTTIGQADVAGVTLFYPDKAEQQRITSSLSILDDLIAAATQELDNLKIYKKGLMQKLFPSAEVDA